MWLIVVDLLKKPKENRPATFELTKYYKKLLIPIHMMLQVYVPPLHVITSALLCEAHDLYIVRTEPWE